MKKQLYTIVTAAIIVVGHWGCSKQPVSPVADLTAAPAGFPEIPFPPDNPYTPAKWQLGKKLFYERSLSSDNSVSCGSCHHANSAFSDTVAFSIGAGGLTGDRNAPSLANVAYHPYYTRDGGVPTLEMQILVPIQEHAEFNSNIVEIAQRLKENPEYARMSQDVFGRELDAYVITRALATFERTMISGNSPYDRHATSNNRLGMSAQSLRGMELFFSDRTNCSGCHNSFNFTNYSFENNGLYTDYKDKGRARTTGKDEDMALFKVPSLRNVSLTAPYMHDGSIKTLKAVVEHYNSGGQAHRHKSDKIKPLGLTEQEMKDLVAFLETLTDDEFVTNKTFAE